MVTSVGQGQLLCELLSTQASRDQAIGDLLIVKGPTRAPQGAPEESLKQASSETGDMGLGSEGSAFQQTSDEWGGALRRCAWGPLRA